MAKRRSLNKRWSRRSLNSTAVLNDDTNVFEDDSNMWQYLNETNSRPPSILNMTEATGVLGSNSNLVDSNASSSILKYLPKSPEEQQPKTPKTREKPKEPDEKTREDHENPSDSDESLKIKKKRVVLGRSRVLKRGKNIFTMDTSSSAVDEEPPPRFSQKTQEKSNSQVPINSPDSDTSMESDKILKKRPKFRKPVSKSLLASGDDSVVVPSQETRKTSMKPRKTFITGAPEKAESNVTREESESETEQLISQKRRFFNSTRRSRKSVNPFKSILEEIDINEKEKAVEQQKNRDNSNDFVLKVDSLNSEEQKLTDKSAKSKTSNVSGSSISEELKVDKNSSDKREGTIERSQSAANEKEADDAEDDNSDDYESFQDEEIDGEKSDVPEGETANMNHQNLSIDERRSNVTDKKEVPDVSDVSDDAEIFNSRRSKNLSTSQAPEHRSPIISGSMVEASQESEDSDGSSRESPPKDKRITRSSTAVPKTLNYAKGKSDDDSSDSEEEALLDKSKKITQSLKLRSSQLVSDENAKDTSEEELDVETVSDDEPIFSRPSETTQSPSDINKKEISIKSKSKKAPDADEEKEKSMNTSRPGPKSSKTPKKSGIPSKPQITSPELEKSVKSPENQLSKTPKANELTNRPGPKSFKESLSTSRHSETSKASRTPQNQTESLSESSSRKRSMRRTNPSLYELPPKERSPSPSLSGSELERSAGRLSTRSTISKATEKSKTRKIQSDSDDEEREPPKKLPSPRRSSVAPRQHLVPHVNIVIGADSETPPTLPVNESINNQKSRNEGQRDKENVSVNDPGPSTSYKATSGVGDVGAGGDKRKLKQLKLDAMGMQSRTRPLSDSDKSFDEELDKKIREFRRKELMKRAENEEAETAAFKRKMEEMKKEEERKNKRAREQLKAAFKRIDEEYRPVKKKPKTVHPAYLVDGKVYKRPKLPRPKHWATNKLYNFLWKKMEPKFGIETRVRSEKFVLDLAEAVTLITRRKKYENYKGELEALLKKMAKLGIIKNRFDFNGFCYDFLPYEFRIKVVSMLQFGNTHNIPFEPEKLMVPIISDDDDN